MGHIQNFEDLLDFLGRRKWLILVVTLLATIIAGVMAKSRTDVFEAIAAIQVQRAQVGVEAAPASLGGSAQLLQSIEQRLTTRDSMLGVIERHQLYADTPLADEQKVGLLRASIAFQGIETVGNAAFGQPTQLSAILVTARDGEADKAARIANDLAQQILDASASGQMLRARDTLDFYLGREAELAAQITEVERDLATFKNSHTDALSTAAEARRDELVGLDSDIRALDQGLVAVMGEQTALAGRGDALRETERRRLVDLQERISVISAQKAALQARRSQLEAVIADQPEVERRLAALERERELLQTNLEQIASRRAVAEDARQLAERQQGERFALLDRAVTPRWPVNSGARKILIAGLGGGLILALALAFILDMMRPVIRTSAQMERQLGIRPVMALPDLGLSRQASRGWWPGRKSR